MKELQILKMISELSNKDKKLLIEFIDKLNYDEVILDNQEQVFSYPQIN